MKFRSTLLSALLVSTAIAGYASQASAVAVAPIAGTDAASLSALAAQQKAPVVGEEYAPNVTVTSGRSAGYNQTGADAGYTFSTIGGQGGGIPAIPSSAVVNIGFAPTVTAPGRLAGSTAATLCTVPGVLCAPVTGGTTIATRTVAPKTTTKECVYDTYTARTESYAYGTRVTTYNATGGVISTVNTALSASQAQAQLKADLAAYGWCSNPVQSSIPIVGVQ